MKQMRTARLGRNMKYLSLDYTIRAPSLPLLERKEQHH